MAATHKSIGVRFSVDLQEWLGRNGEPLSRQLRYDLKLLRIILELAEDPDLVDLDLRGLVGLARKLVSM